MKKIFVAILVICSLLVMTSCSMLNEVLDNLGITIFDQEDTEPGGDSGNVPGGDSGDVPGGDSGNEPGGDSGNEPGGDSGNVPGGDSGNVPGGDSGNVPGGDSGNEPGGDSGNEPGGDSGNDNIPTHLYTEFTEDELSLILDTLGISLPFIPNDEYYVEEYEYEDELGINFYAFDNTEAEFLSYLDLFNAYTYDGSSEDEYGDTWYYYSVGDVYIDVSFYYNEGYVVDLYAYFIIDGGDDGSDNGGGTDEPSSDWEELYDCITVKEALEICAESGSTKSDRYYLIATIVSIDDYYYGQMTVKDSTGSILVYGTYGADGEDRYGDLYDVPSVGDTVLLYGNFMTYKGTPEMYSGWIIDYRASSGDNTPDEDDPTDTEHTYTEFTDEELDFILDTIGITLPFIPNDEYYLEEYESEDEYGVNFYAFGNTEAEFLDYLELLDTYTYDGSADDEYGDTWYYYSVGDVYIDVTFYYYEGDYVLDLYAYFIDENGDGSGDSGNTGGDQDTDVDLITNAGAGLPEGTDGVHNVDFSEATNVKDVTDQGYYLDGCPTTGSPAVLVIPVEFQDSKAASKGYTTEAIENAFLKDGNTDYYSVYDYYFISSYGQLELDITVLDFWFCPTYSSTYYYNATYDYYGSETEIGDQLVLNEALAHLEGIMDLSEFDSDNNGIIDAVVLINTLDIGDENFYWAYRYWNIYTDDEGYYYEYDGVSANDYMWASYQFLHESSDESTGETVYTDKNAMNTYTYIHEFGHVLGADDYYDTEYVSDPMSGFDIMDSMLGDHNAYTKFNLGWIKESRLVVTDTSVTLTLESFTKNGDTVIIANNWDDTLGAYQEYYVLMYYTGTGLNADNGGYFLRDGIVVYHVNASLYKDVSEGETYYDVYNNNTDPSSEYGTEDNLIEYVKSAADTYTFAEGDTLPAVYDDAGNKLRYTFTVDSLTETEATVTFSVAK